jgi:hypothetical protein
LERRDLFDDFLHQREIQADFVSPVKKLSAEEDAFFFQVNCANEVQGSVCEMVKAGLISAGNRIASQLFIQSQIRVNCTIQNFTTRRLLASASSSNEYEISNQNVTLLYPQALAKQFALPGTQYSDFDILAAFNSQVNWYFRNQTLPISNEQYDFEYVAIHELLHGMGFKTNLISSRTLHAMGLKEFKVDYLVPPPVYNSKRREMSFALSGAFDFYIESSLGSFKSLQSTVQRFTSQSNHYASFFQNFEQSLELEAARQLYQVATSKDTYLVLPMNQTVLLHTPLNYTQGTSLSHVHSLYTTLPEFVMLPSAIPGFTLDYMIRGSESPGALGPRTLAILEALGWNQRLGIPRQ